MRYQIVWAESAARELGKLEPSVARQIYSRVGELANNPYRNVKKLAGERGFRLRVGDYRVIFDIDGERLNILVLKVGHRSRIYRQN